VLAGTLNTAQSNPITFCSLVLISNIFSCDLIFQVPSVLVRSHWAWRLVGAFYLMLCWEGETLASEQFSARRVLTFFYMCLMLFV